MNEISFVSFEKIARLSRDCVVTEKIDGTNAQLYILPLNSTSNIINDFNERGWGVVKNGDFHYGIMPGSRNRWLKLNKDNAGFCQWVLEHSEELLQLGPGRHFGEWWGLGIQRGYDMKEKRFSLFNVGRWGAEESRPKCCHVVPTLYEGMFTTESIDRCMDELRERGSVASLDFKRPEGIVVFHTAQGYLFKKTLEGDESHKSIEKDN